MKPMVFGLGMVILLLSVVILIIVIVRRRKKEQFINPEIDFPKIMADLIRKTANNELRWYGSGGPPDLYRYSYSTFCEFVLRDQPRILLKARPRTLYIENTFIATGDELLLPLVMAIREQGARNEKDYLKGEKNKFTKSLKEISAG